MRNHPGRRIIVALLLAACACVKQPSASADSAAGNAATPSTRDSAKPAAAGDSGQPVELRTDRSTYRAGDRVMMTIINHTGQSWAFNACTRIIEQQRGATWEAVPDARRCTMIAQILGPSATTSATGNFDSSLDAGTYRLVIAFAGDGQPPGRQTSAASAPVTITK